MTGKGIPVTGAGTGSGRGIALEFARRGVRAAVHYSRRLTGRPIAVPARAVAMAALALAGAGCLAASAEPANNELQPPFSARSRADENGWRCVRTGPAPDRSSPRPQT